MNSVYYTLKSAKTYTKIESELTMPKPRTKTGEKNLIGKRLIELREQRGWSQRDLAHQLQLINCDMDKNVITRIETNKRYVTDIELQALCRVLKVSYDYLIDGTEE